MRNSLRARNTGSPPWPHSNPPLVTILFNKHRGATYPQAAALATQARVAREHVDGRHIQHVATFARTAQQASAAVALLQLTVNVKGTLVFDGDGLLVPNSWKGLPILDCYRQAELCDNPTACCHMVIADPFRRRGAFALGDDDGAADRWLLPCRRINPTYLEFDARHPASATSLIQAAAVRNGSSWCPSFRAAAFRPVLVGQRRSDIPSRRPFWEVRP